MSDSNLTKKDVFDFLMLGKKIVFSGAGTVLVAAKSKVAELTDSELALEKQVAAKVKAMVSSGLTEAKARKAVNDIMKARLDKALKKSAKSSGDTATK